MVIGEDEGIVHDKSEMHREANIGGEAASRYPEGDPNQPIHLSRDEYLAEEVVSMRRAYESGEYVRLEDQDGMWVLHVRMEFDDPAAAVEALARVATGLSRAGRA